LIVLGLLAFGTARPAVAQRAGAQRPAGNPRAQIPQRRPSANRVAAGPRQPPARIAPQELKRPFPLPSVREQRHLDAVLTQWEAKSKEIKKFKCDFKRWEYNQTFMQDPNVFWTYSTGRIQYGQPDKGFFEVVQKGQYTKPAKLGSKVTYPMKPGEEKFICDGISLYEYDFNQKVLIQRDLPPGMRGKSVLEGVLPFLFGVKKRELNQRYWLKVLPLPRQPKLIAIDTYPKWPADAANFSRATVYLTRAYVPDGLRLEMPGGHEQTSYKFSKNPLGIGILPFPKPNLPLVGGWKKVVQPFPVGDAPVQRPAGNVIRPLAQPTRAVTRPARTATQPRVRQQRR